jgi:hypothetical protein
MDDISDGKTDGVYLVTFVFSAEDHTVTVGIGGAGSGPAIVPGTLHLGTGHRGLGVVKDRNDHLGPPIFLIDAHTAVQIRHKDPIGRWR